MLSSSLCDYSNAYILVSGTITITDVAAGGGNNSKQVVFKNFAPFTNCTNESEINNTQIDNAKYIDVLIPIYNLIEYTNNYSKTSVGLWQYYIDETVLADDGTPTSFAGNNASFKYKQKITDSTGDDGTKAIQIMVPLKYLSNFCRTLEIPLINCKFSLILT